MDNQRIHSLSLDRSKPIPLYFQIKEFLLDLIRNNTLSPGDILPTELNFCELYSVSRTTIRQAINELVDEGYLYRIKGSGTYVSHTKIYHDFAKENEVFTKNMLHKGFIPSTKILHFGIITAPKNVKDTLNLPDQAKVISLKRIRYVNSEPLLISYTYLPFPLCKHVLEYDFEEASLYHVLSKNINTKILKISKNLEAVCSTKRDMEQLGISKTTAIQLIHNIGYNYLNTPIDYTISRYRGDKNTFIITQNIEEK